MRDLDRFIVNRIEKLELVCPLSEYPAVLARLRLSGFEARHYLSEIDKSDTVPLNSMPKECLIIASREEVRRRGS